MLNALGESGQQRGEAGDEGSICTPVDAAIIPVDAIAAVELVDIELALLDNIVITDHDASQRSHEAGIATQESQQASGVLDDIPGSRNDAENGNEQRSSENVDVLGRNSGNIIGEGISTSSDLISDGGEDEAESSEEFGGTRIKVCNDGWHVPLEFSPEVLVGGSDEDWSKRSQRSNHW